MKKIIATLLLVAGSFAVTMAQQPHKKQGERQANPEKMLEKMTATLSLTPDQQSKIKPILTDAQKTMKSNREKYKGKRKCMAQARYQTRKATEEKIMAVLTPEQQIKFNEEKKKKMEERRKKREEELSKPIDCKE